MFQRLVEKAFLDFSFVDVPLDAQKVNNCLQRGRYSNQDGRFLLV